MAQAESPDRRAAQGRAPLNNEPLPVVRGEPNLVVFVSSVMSPDLLPVRARVARAIRRVPPWEPWLFEEVPASTEDAVTGYLRHARGSERLLWLVTELTTPPVEAEVRAALGAQVPVLAIELPSAERDEVTRTLLAAVRRRHRSRPVGDLAHLEQHVADALQDETAIAVRLYRSIAPATRARALGSLSRARIVALFQGAGATYEQAVAAGDDAALGALPDDLRPSAKRPLVLLHGPVGAGKTLAAHRYYEEALDASHQSGLTLPVLLQGADLLRPLPELMKDRASEFAIEPDRLSPVVIDPSDGALLERGSALLDEARQIAHASQSRRVLLTSRPYDVFVKSEEAQPLPPLEEDRALAVIARFVGSEFHRVHTFGWPKSMREAIRRPLFAILVAAFLRDHPVGTPRTRSALIADVVSRALQSVSVVDTAPLRRLAIRSLERGGSAVPAAEVGRLDEFERLTTSGLVTLRERSVAFTLPIIGEWFAAQGLLNREVHLDRLAGGIEQIVDLWIPPLVIALGQAPHHTVTSLLHPLTGPAPGALPYVVDGATTGPWLRTDVAAPPALECGQAVRDALLGWTNAIGPLARRIAPLRENGELRSIGVRTSGTQLEVTLYGGDQPHPPVVVPAVGQLEEWRVLRIGAPGDEGAWAWRWGLDHLRERLRQHVDDRAFPASHEVLARETAWAVAEALGLQEGYALSDLRGIVTAELAARPHAGRARDRVTAVMDAITLLERAGETAVVRPWPADPRSPGGINLELLAARSHEVFAAGLEAYVSLTQDWFPRLRERFSTWVSLPAAIVVKVAPAENPKVGALWQYFFEPLAASEASHVTVEIVGKIPDWDRQLYTRLARVRPNAASWIHSVVYHDTFPEIYSQAPATALAYEWLEKDLRAIDWLS